MKLREKREDSFLEARLNFEGRWQDVLIRNVSKHGAMIQCQVPPPRGSYVEIRRGRYAIVGHVRWNGTNRFGARSQDVIDLGLLEDDSQKRCVSSPERRSALRIAPRRLPTDMRHDREIGRIFEFAVLVVAIAMCTILLAFSLKDVLSIPANAASQALQTTAAM